MNLTFEKSMELTKKGAALDATLRIRPCSISVGYETGTAFPNFCSKAKGQFIWDVDGNRYLDFVLGMGTVLIGHCDDRVNSAVFRQMEIGISPTLSAPIQVELAERLVHSIPGAESVVFLKTGSDATSAAVKLARAFTGKNRVLRWGYNGWHDWCASRSCGVPKQYRDLTLDFQFNDYESVQRCFEEYKDEIACVIMMPYEIESPSNGFLNEVKKLANLNGALFILDEMRSGFRLAIGGAQEYFGIRADLATYSKGIANGYSISAVCGRDDVLSMLPKISLSSVFFRGPCEMAAANATIQILEQEMPYDHLWSLGKQFLDGMKSAAATVGVPACPVGLPPTPFLKFGYPDEGLNTLAMKTFCLSMLNDGVILHPGHHWYVCTSMQKNCIDYAIEKSEIAFKAVSAVIH